MKIKYDNMIKTYLDDKMDDKIRGYCREKGITISDFLRELIDNFFNQQIEQGEN